eukprot:113463-Amphidinium_carterae.1
MNGLPLAKMSKYATSFRCIKGACSTQQERAGIAGGSSFRFSSSQNAYHEDCETRRQDQKVPILA